MTQWKMTMAAALAGLMVAAPAFAQSTTARRKAAMATGDEQVKAAQQALKDKGHDPGGVDGKMGPKTQAALRDFQNAQGIQATGHLDAKTMQSLGMDGGRTGSASPFATAGSASPSTTTEEKK